eukprot:2315085-Pyramimonas_sp.AAC.1
MISFLAPSRSYRSLWARWLEIFPASMKLTRSPRRRPSSVWSTFSQRSELRLPISSAKRRTRSRPS